MLIELNYELRWNDNEHIFISFICILFLKIVDILAIKELNMEVLKVIYCYQSGEKKKTYSTMCDDCK